MGLEREAPAYPEQSHRRARLPQAAPGVQPRPLVPLEFEQGRQRPEPRRRRGVHPLGLAEVALEVPRHEAQRRSAHGPHEVEVRPERAQEPAGVDVPPGAGGEGAREGPYRLVEAARSPVELAARDAGQGRREGPRRRRGGGVAPTAVAVADGAVVVVVVVVVAPLVGRRGGGTDGETEVAVAVELELVQRAGGVVRDPADRPCPLLGDHPFSFLPFPFPLFRCRDSDSWIEWIGRSLRVSYIIGILVGVYSVESLAL